ncbi:MAG: methyltransferase domain-containing protein [Nakamurella sp.]
MGFNQELFDRVAAVYDESPPFFTTVGRILAERAAIPDGSTVLDLGAGTGAATMAVRASMPHGPIIAVDTSSGMLGALDALALPDVRTLQADLVDLPLPDTSIDHAVAGFVLHILADQHTAFREIHRVLAPGGSLTWSLPGGHPDAVEWDRAYRAIYQRYESRIVDIPAEMTPPVDLDGALLAAGFTVESVESVPVSLPVGDADGYWRWTQSHGARWVTDALPPDGARELRRDVIAALQHWHPTGGADLMLAPQITRMLRN